MAVWLGPPRSYTPGRNRPIQYVVIHSTEGSEGPTSAEAGAAYDKVRTDGTSTHLFVDSNSAVREVQDADRAHAARFHGNEIGLQVELCGRAGQTSAQWHDDVSAATLRLAAREVAQMCRDHAIPVRRLSVAEVRAAYYNAPGAKPKGICGHIDVTKAYPEDNGTHNDPGPSFPWDEFLNAVRAELGQSPGSGDDMAEIMVTLTDGPGGVWLSNYQTYRPVGGDGEYAFHVGRGVPEVKVPASQLGRYGVPVGQTATAPVALTDADRATIVAALKGDLVAEIRDAVADLGEGGAARVRAPE